MKATPDDADFFTPDRVSQPVLVVGVPRSGTTMLRLMLNRSPDLAVLPETWFGPRVWDQRWAFPLRDEPQHSLRRAVDRFIMLLTTKQPGDFPIDLNLYRERVLSGPASLNRLLSELGRLWAETEDKSRWGEKSPVHIHYLTPLAEMFPLMKVVHIVRDPRDVCVSLAEVPFSLSKDVVVHALEWKNGVAAIANAYADRRIQITTVRYEDLVSDPAIELTRLCRFLGIGYEEDMINFHEDYETYAPKHEWIQGVKEPLNASSVGRFKRKLAPDDLRLIEALLLEGLGRYGYEPTCHPSDFHTLRPLVQRLHEAQEARSDADKARRSSQVAMGKGSYSDLLNAVTSPLDITPEQ